MITVFGAGAIGCYVGGMLALTGQHVTLVGRAGLEDKLAKGFFVTAQGGQKREVPQDMFSVVTELSHAPAAETVLVCVKSGDTEEAAQTIARDASQGARVISLQNGLTNPAVLSKHLDGGRVVPGMVGFNVVELEPGSFVQTTEGEVILGQGGAGLVSILDQSDVSALVHSNMSGVQWSKLLLNLNNSINTLSGLGLKAQLEDAGWRRVLSHCITEALGVARAEGVVLEQIGKVPPKALPYLLRLPNVLFTRVARAMLAIDPTARSSMAEDYEKGRKSEVDYLNGYIAERASTHGREAPINVRVTLLVQDAFADPKRPRMTLTAWDVLGR